MANIKFSQLPNLGTITGTVTIPVVDSLTNYTVTTANLKSFITTSAGNITAATVSATGNITGSYILGNGSLLTGLPATYGNANVAAYLPTFTGNLAGGNITVTGTAQAASIIATGGVSATGNITGAYVIGNGSQLSAITAANIVGTVANAAYAATAGTAATANTAASASTAATVTGAAQAAITSVGTLTSLAVSGNTSVGNLNSSGNITGTYVKGNGSELTNIVTSIIAGSGISVNQATGAVTVTATGNGGGAGNSISFGTSNVNIASANANITFSVGGTVNQMVLTNLDGNVGFTGANFNTGVQIGSASNASRLVAWGNISMALNAGTTVDIGGSLNVLTGTTTTQYLTVNNTATLPTTNVTGNVSISGGFLGIAPSTRANNSPGTTGQISTDSNYLYVCTATNTWKRVALTAF